MRRSAGDLNIDCVLTGQLPAKARVVSRANAGLAGNILFGGAIGAVVDAGNGSAFTYPTWLQLVFGEERFFDRRENRGDGLSTGTLVSKTTGEVERTGTAAPLPASPAASETMPALRVGDTFEYLRTDQITGNTSKVFYTVDRVTATETAFSQGARVEHKDGRVTIQSAVGGIFDSSSPPRGWARPNVQTGMAWSEQYPKHRLRAVATGEGNYMLDGKSLRVVQIRYTGWQENTVFFNGSMDRAFPMEVQVLYSPDLNRVVQFEAETRAFSGTAKELLQLQNISRR